MLIIGHNSRMAFVENIGQVNKIFIYDDQGAGRCILGTAAVRYHLRSAALMESIEILPGGLNEPDTKRKTVHQVIAREAILRYTDHAIFDNLIHKLHPNDMAGVVIALGLTSNSPPDFLLEKAFDVLIAPTIDPFHNLNESLKSTIRHIDLIAWQFSQVLLSRFDELGNSRDLKGAVIPRSLAMFQPPNVEPEYDLGSPMNVVNHNDLDRPMESWQVARVGKSW